ncbi:MFS transporter [Marinomonas agarivorans]|nr:MFS transporter [Marinomonas agarivorans]
MVKQTILPIWTLLFGMLILSMASGLQGSLLGIRASIESFDTTVTGLIMSGYYLGFVLGSFVVPLWVKNVGHIRVFAAVASLASITILLQSVVIEPIFWTVMRAGTGFCYAGLFIVAESWLNDISSNATRGRLLSVYMIIIFGGYTLGQMLLNISSAEGYILFILSSVLISLALVPLLLVRTSSPSINVPEKLDLIKLIRVTPLGVTGVALSGVITGAIIGLSAVYGQSVGMSSGELSLFLGISFIGGLALQWPIGKLSDVQDRRITILLVAVLGIATSVMVPIGVAQANPMVMLIGMFMVGAFSFPMYSLAASHISDQIPSEQILSASSGMILFNGLGGIVGPILAASLMDSIHVNALYWFIGATNLIIVLIALLRIYLQPPMNIEDQSDQLPVAMTVSPVAAAEMLVDADETQSAPEEITEVEIKL